MDYHDTERGQIRQFVSVTQLANSKGWVVVSFVLGLVFLALFWNALYYPDPARTPLLVAGIIMVLYSVYRLIPPDHD